MDMVLVEDDIGWSRTLIRIFTKFGFKITHFVDVARAKLHLEETHPDVLLLDRQVNGGDGWELRNVIDPKLTHVVLMTAAPLRGVKVPFFRKGDDSVSRLITMVIER